MLVYLDIDGVLIPDRDSAAGIAPVMVDRVHQILDATGAQLVVSSHRRRSPATVLALLADAGLGDCELFGSAWSTPDSLPDLNDDLSVRGQEIQAHIDQHGVVDFVILDDCPVLPAHAARHIQPDPAIGLTDDHVAKAISLLQV